MSSALVERLDIICSMIKGRGGLVPGGGGVIANSANLPIFAIQIGKIRPPYLARPAVGDPQTQKGGGGWELGRRG